MIPNYNNIIIQVCERLVVLYNEKPLNHTKILQYELMLDYYGELLTKDATIDRIGVLFDKLQKITKEIEIRIGNPILN
jgi:hypothetical protein